MDNDATNSTESDTSPNAPVETSFTASTVKIKFSKKIIEKGNAVDFEVIVGLIHNDYDCDLLAYIEEGDLIGTGLVSDLEALITDNWVIFCEVGMALNHIKDYGLYRFTHDSFEAYCKDKFKLEEIKDN